MRRLSWILALGVAGGLLAEEPPGLITFNDDGAWCWYQDERVIVHDGKLIIGSVAAGVNDPPREGDIEATVHDLETGETSRVELHDRLRSGRNSYDDHNAPAFLVRPDGRLLAVYSAHGPEPHFYYRISERAGDPTRWSAVRKYEVSPTTRLTYSNLLMLRKENAGAGRIYNFFRGLDDTFKPSYAWSDDAGESWTTGGVVIDVPLQQRHRPYVKYASNGEDTIHLFYTEGHPHVYPNSVYHAFYQEGNLHTSDGTVIRSLREGLRKPEEGTRIFQGSETRRAWTSDLHVDSKGRPVAVFSVKVDPADTPVGAGGLDHRYHYARWDGSRWVEHEIAYGGSRLYWWQDDYTGNIAIDPDRPETVYVSTDADPVTGQPLKSRSDGARHFEIYQGVTEDGGTNWKWTAVTKDSRADNIRPVVPIGDGQHTVLLWMRGTYRSYVNYNLEIVGTISRE